MRIPVRLLPTLLLAGSVFAVAQDTPKPDNTRANQGDGKAGAVTADQQKADSSDRDITKNIRRSIMSDKSLSTYAHNVKIITQNGSVTLKGPVRSDTEKQSIEAKAMAIAGANRVADQLTVKQ